MIQSVNFKINIGLYVTEKRSDGFHNIETIFYPVKRTCDTLTMERCEAGLSFTVENADFSVDTENNLCVKAFRRLQERFAIDGVVMHLHKRIPSGAGLGGGSADAAAVLRMAQQLFDLPITEAELMAIAATLGSDVPFFLMNTPAYATQKGDHLQPITLNLNAKVISVFKPAFSIATAAAYAKVKPMAHRTPLTELVQNDLRQWRSLIPNDFEQALAQHYPQLQQMKEQFYALGADYASLSGSGSALFAIADYPIDLSPYFEGINL